MATNSYITSESNNIKFRFDKKISTAYNLIPPPPISICSPSEGKKAEQGHFSSSDHTFICYASHNTNIPGRILLLRIFVFVTRKFLWNSFVVIF